MLGKARIVNDGVGNELQVVVIGHVANIGNAAAGLDLVKTFFGEENAEISASKRRDSAVLGRVIRERRIKVAILTINIKELLSIVGIKEVFGNGTVSAGLVRRRPKSIGRSFANIIIFFVARLDRFSGIRPEIAKAVGVRRRFKPSAVKRLDLILTSLSLSSFDSVSSAVEGVIKLKSVFIHLGVLKRQPILVVIRSVGIKRLVNVVKRRIERAGNIAGSGNNIGNVASGKRLHGVKGISEIFLDLIVFTIERVLAGQIRTILVKEQLIVVIITFEGQLLLRRKVGRILAGNLEKDGIDAFASFNRRRSNRLRLFAVIDVLGAVPPFGGKLSLILLRKGILLAFPAGIAGNGTIA